MRKRNEKGMKKVKKTGISLMLMITLVISQPSNMLVKARITMENSRNASNTSVNLSSIYNTLESSNTPTLTPTPTVPPLNSTPTISPIPTEPPFVSTPTEPLEGTEAPVTPTEPPTTPPETTLTPTIMPDISPTPTLPLFRAKTLNLMAEYDYLSDSVTGVSQVKATLAELQKGLKGIGTLRGTGMPYEQYEKAMSYQWEDETQYDKQPVSIKVDITKTMDYNAYITVLKKLSRYEGVYLYKIGTSTQGRALYAVEIDMDSDYNKNVIMLTGQVHAREFGGGTYIVKQLVDLVQKAQTDKKTKELLKKNKYVAVPIINVDGREALIKTPGKYTKKDGTLWKAYPNGTDGNRNFPGLHWGQLLKGNKLNPIIEQKPGYANYPGTYAGSMNETKALMKWLYHYIVVEKAKIYLDMHMQGSIIYAGKTWQTKAQEKLSTDLRTGVMEVLNKGITKRKYIPVYESSIYGLKGEGSSLTDYAISLGVGAKFSPAYGFLAFTDGEKEYILMQIKDLDQTKLRFDAQNPNIAAITLEIGYGVKYLGNSNNARTLLANEYNYYNYGKLLEALPKVIK